MPISNLNHCAARQVGTAHISVVIANFKKEVAFALLFAVYKNKKGV